MFLALFSREKKPEQSEYHNFAFRPAKILYFGAIKRAFFVLCRQKLILSCFPDSKLAEFLIISTWPCFAELGAK